VLVPVVVNPGRVRGGVPGDVLGSFQIAIVFEVGRDAGRAERVAGDLGGIEAGLLGSPLDHLEDIVGLEAPAGQLAGAPFQ